MKASRLRKFGDGSMADRAGYDLDIIIGWLEDMADEEDQRSAQTGPKRKRLNKVWDAIVLLQEANQ